MTASKLKSKAKTVTIAKQREKKARKIYLLQTEECYPITPVEEFHSYYSPTSPTYVPTPPTYDSDWECEESEL